jgi:hypothetical protein
MGPKRGMSLSKKLASSVTQIWLLFGILLRLKIIGSFFILCAHDGTELGICLVNQLRGVEPFSENLQLFSGQDFSYFREIRKWFRSFDDPWYQCRSPRHSVGRHSLVGQASY